MSALDHFFLLEDLPEYPMTFPSQWEFTGQIQRAAFESALQQSLERHPTLWSVLKPLKQGKLCWTRPSEGVQPAVHWGSYGAAIHFNEHPRLDPRESPGFRIWIREGATKSSILFEFHHAVTDGTGAHRFIGDLFAIYGQQTCGEDDPPILEDSDPRSIKNRNRRLADIFHQGTTWQVIRIALNQVWELMRERFGLLQTAKDQQAADGKQLLHDEFPGFAVHSFTVSQHKALRNVAQEKGVTLNDLLLAELFRALQLWNRQNFAGSLNRRLSIMMPSDLREKEDYYMPATNMTSYTFIKRGWKEISQEATLLSGIRNETAMIKHDRKATRFIDTLIAATYIPGLLPLICRMDKCLATAVLSHVGDPCRRFTSSFPRREGKSVVGNLLMESAAGVSPVRKHTRVAVTINTMYRQLNLAARCDPHFFSMEDTSNFLNLYAAQVERHLK